MDSHMITAQYLRDWPFNEDLSTDATVSQISLKSTFNTMRWKEKQQPELWALLPIVFSITNNCTRWRWETLMGSQMITAEYIRD
jgi:hypothetical protein